MWFVVFFCSYAFTKRVRVSNRRCVYRVCVFSFYNRLLVCVVDVCLLPAPSRWCVVGVCLLFAICTNEVMRFLGGYRKCIKNNFF